MHPLRNPLELRIRRQDTLSEIIRLGTEDDLVMLKFCIPPDGDAVAELAPAGTPDADANEGCPVHASPKAYLDALIRADLEKSEVATSRCANGRRSSTRAGASSPSTTRTGASR